MSQASPSLVIITGNSWRHRYFANRLAGSFEVRGVVSEETRTLPQDADPSVNRIIEEHVLERIEKERMFFGGEVNFNVPTGKVLIIARGESNSGETFAWIKQTKPDLVVLFGSSIITDPILSAFEDKVINLHLGLSPYYRGSATGFWPLVRGEPECIGATVHLAVLKADAGAILGQVRPELTATDGCQEIGYKNIMAGTKLMVKLLKAYHAGALNPRPQQLGRGRVFRLSDFNAGHVLRMRDNFKNGMVAEYLKEKEIRDGRYPIVAPNFL